MPARRDPGTKVETKLGALRVRRGVTQHELAEATGISVYIRLEHGRLKNPPIRYPANCAIALGVRWIAFSRTSGRAGRPSTAPPASRRSR